MVDGWIGMVSKAKAVKLWEEVRDIDVDDSSLDQSKLSDDIDFVSDDELEDEYYD